KVPMVIGDSVDACNYLKVQPAASLTLGDKVVLKFFPPNGRIEVNGAMIANAAAGNKITFTSIKYDSIGGDTNADGAASAPAAGDWAQIWLVGNGSQFNNTVFTYGGNADESVLYIDGPSAKLTNSTFAHNGDLDSIDAKPALNAWYATTGTVLTGNTFYDNYVPLGISTAFSIDDSNTFDNAVAAPTKPQPNKYNAINLGGCGHFTNTISLAATKVPFVVGDSSTACTYLVLEPNAHVTVATNTIFKFWPTGQVEFNSGGTMPNYANAIFTSVRDDAHGGDTNADGTITSPVYGSWLGFRMDHADGSSNYIPQNSPRIAQP